MTIRTRLSVWYAAVLTVSLLIIGAGTYQELTERHRRMTKDELSRVAIGETGELLVQVGLPAVVLGVLGGWWLTRRALAPISALTQAAEKIDERNLASRIPRSGNGDELDRLAEVLNAMTVRLDGSFQRIREFTLHASHELKTPLAILRAQLETALRDEPLTPAARELCASQLDDLRRLTRIVDNLTLLAKADAGQVQLGRETVRLDELVRDIFEDSKILAEPLDVRVQLAACEAATVNGDAHRLRELLLNLADNAVKYNRSAGSITMSLRKHDGAAVFVIANTGPGIAPEVLPRVFDRFYRGDPAHSKDIEGCGLGLSIAQWIVSAHKGSVAINSVPDELTTVTVRLPCE